MVNSRTLKSSRDDAMLALRLDTFEGGLDSETDPQDLDPKFSPNCQNVKLSQFGRIIGRDGYQALIALLPASPDGIQFFYDSNGTKHIVLWCAGNLYDVTAFNLGTVIGANVYTAGHRITSVALNNVLYYSDGFTITGGTSGTRMWDPTLSTTDSPLMSSGTTGTIATPACKVMAIVAGSLIFGDIKYTNGTVNHSGFLFANVNDPTTVVGTNIQQVGQGQGGVINCIMSLGVAAVGISPISSILVGKSQFGLYLYTGALGTLKESITNCPTGVRDGATLQYIPGPDGSGFAVFLGTDNKVWGLNGTQAVEISKTIRTELKNSVTDLFSATPTAPITSVVNILDFQYILDVGNRKQYVYHYNTNSWSRYQGWPSGFYCQALDFAGQPIMYQADFTAKTLSQVNIGNTDNGAGINPYWSTPLLSATDKNILKIWKWFFLSYRTDFATITVSAQANLAQGDALQRTITPPTTIAAGSSLIWGQGQWGVNIWGSDNGAYTVFKGKTRLTLPRSSVSPANPSFPLAVEPNAPAPSPGSLHGYDVTITLSTTTVGAHFEILGFTLLYLPRGRKRVVATN